MQCYKCTENNPIKEEIIISNQDMIVFTSGGSDVSPKSNDRWRWGCTDKENEDNSLKY